jgi:hypothetical protein
MALHYEWTRNSQHVLGLDVSVARAAAVDLRRRRQQLKGHPALSEVGDEGSTRAT